MTVVFLIKGTLEYDYEEEEDFNKIPFSCK